MLSLLNKIILIYSVTLLSFNYGHAQLENQHWLFGQFAWLDFSTASPTITSGSLMDAHFEGCTSISDECGNLLFYSDGSTIWTHQNGSHSIMQNGTGLLGNASATQSAVLIKNPSKDSIYYIVTVDSKYGNDGANISTIDRSLNGGLGGVVTIPSNPYETAKNTPLLNSKSEKIAYFHDCNSNVSWFILHDYSNSEYVLYKIDGNGISAPINYPSLANYNWSTGEIGQIKFSEDGNRIACAFFDATSSGGLIEFMDFDPATGIPSNPTIFTTSSNKVYGVEFSPNNNFLYYTILLPVGELHQIELSTFNDILVYSEPIVNLEMASLQIAPNDKIYVAFANNTGNAFSHNTIGVINAPNLSGSSCAFNPIQIALPSGTMVKRGLPNFSNNYCRSVNNIEYAFTCGSTNIQFNLEETGIAADSIVWDFGDPSSGVLNIGYGENSVHTYSSTGNYDIQTIIYKSCYNDTIELNLNVNTLLAAFTASDTNGSPSLDVDFIDQSIGAGLTYQWNFGDGNISIVDSPSHTFNTAGTFETVLIVTDNQGCTDTAEVTITVADEGAITIPSVFTPNADGQNDVFSVVGNFKYMHIIIYNRWGQVMADLLGSKVKWDGRTMTGVEVPEGTYFYLIEVIDLNESRSEFTGHLMLRR